MDAAQALADLTEISAQIESAVLAASDGSLVASTSEPSRGEELARAAAELVAAAGEVAEGTPELVQLQAATPRGSLFVVRDPRHLAAAITAPKPTVGLIFYDLKTCLRMLEPEAEPVKAATPAKATAAAATEEEPAKATGKETKVGKASGTRRRTTTKKKEPDEST